MKKVKVAWIEQILEFDSVEEATGYRKSLETGRPQLFKILNERITENGKVEIRIRKQYNNNAFPDD